MKESIMQYISKEIKQTSDFAYKKGFNLGMIAGFIICLGTTIILQLIFNYI